MVSPAATRAMARPRVLGDLIDTCAFHQAEADIPPSYVGYPHARRIFKLEDVLQAHLASCPKVDSELRRIELSIELSGAGTRGVFNGRRHWVTSLHPSRKAGRPIQCEGRNELSFARQMEVDYGVVDFRSQAPICWLFL